MAVRALFHKFACSFYFKVAGWGHRSNKVGSLKCVAFKLVTLCCDQVVRNIKQKNI